MLAALNAAVYLSLAAGVVMLLRSAPVPREWNFNDLGEVLRARFPDLPAGFTLREGLARAKKLEPRLDWREIDRALTAYEAQRYGGFTADVAAQPAVVILFAALRRSGR